MVYGSGRVWANNGRDAFRRGLSRGGCIDVVVVVCFRWRGTFFFLSFFSSNEHDVLQVRDHICLVYLSTSSLACITAIGIIIFPYRRTYPTVNGPLGNHCAPKRSQQQSIWRPSFANFLNSEPAHNRTQPNSNICCPRTETKPGDMPSKCPHRVDTTLPIKTKSWISVPITYATVLLC